MLGASYFKKYWPVQGSLWNKKHINKNNIKDLEDVIDNANNYSSTHIQGLVTESIIFVPIIFMAKFHGNQKARYSVLILPFLWFIHFYALLIHQHNRIRARLAITTLMLNDKEIEKQRVAEREKSELISIEQGKNGFYPHFGYKPLSPELAGRQQANDYREYLYQLWSKDWFKISEAVFAGDIVNIYQQWKKSVK